jgi:ABC-type uncharacterized transport system auxiliary subunit
MKKCFFLSAPLLMIMLAAGCSRTAMVRNYYVLEPQRFFDRADFGLEESLPYHVDIRDFNVARPFAQNRIAVRSASHEMNYYSFNFWATRPSSTITYMVYRLVENSGIFDRTDLEFTVSSDYIITGDVHKLELVQENKKLHAHLEMTFRFVETKYQHAIVRHDFDRQVELPMRSMNNFAWAVSEILREETELFLHKVVKKLQEDSENQ